MPAICELRPGDTLIIGGTEVTLEYKTGPRARLIVDAPAEVKITVKKTGRMSAMNVENEHGKHPVRQGPSAVP